MKTKFSNHEAVRLQFMTQSVNSLLSGENCLKQRKSTYDKRFIRYHKCFFLKLRYGAHAKTLRFFFISARTDRNTSKERCICPSDPLHKEERRRSFPSNISRKTRIYPALRARQGKASRLPWGHPQGSS